MTDPNDPGYLPGPDAAWTASANPAVDPLQGPGQRLRQARLNQGYDVRQVARDLRLTTERVLALENDDYQALPAPVFVVGYIRTYARLLDLDPEALVEAYRVFQAPPSATAPVRLPAASTRLGRHESHWVAIAAALLVILLTLAWWLRREPEVVALTNSGLARPLPDQGILAPSELGQGGALAESLAMPGVKNPPLAPGEQARNGNQVRGAAVSGAARQVPADASGETPDQTRASSPADGDLELIPEEEGMSGLAEEPEQPTGTEVDSVAPPAPDSGPPEADVAQGEEKLDVVISFTGPTTVDIRDSTMNYALVGEMDQGDQHLLGGKPPYSLIIGNAAVTRLQVGGQPFDFQSVVRGNVARFILDPAPKAPAP